jgi:restriction system protein
VQPDDDRRQSVTALQWLGVWACATALFALMGLLSSAIWLLAALTGLIFLVQGWRSWLAWLGRRQDTRLDALYRASGQGAIDAMTGVEFERYVAAVLRGAGYTVSFTRATGDFGVDLIAAKNGVRTAVQCKRQARTVGGAAVQQVVAGAPVHGCTATMVVSNHRYTRAAMQLAEVHQCLLVDRTGLVRLARAAV